MSEFCLKYFFLIKELRPGMECLPLEMNDELQAIEKKKYLCYTKAAKYKLYWSRINPEKIRENRCLTIKNKSTCENQYSRFNQMEHSLCGN